VLPLAVYVASTAGLEGNVSAILNTRQC
jgi:hypothetical protein